MADPKAPVQPDEQPEKPLEAPEDNNESKAPTGSKDDITKKQDPEADSKAVSKADPKINWQEKYEQEKKTWEGRFKKLQTVEKLATVLADGEEGEEGEDPAELALAKIEKMEDEMKKDKLELAKEKVINQLDIPDEVKNMLRTTVPASENFEVKAEEAVQSLMPLIQKQPVSKPKPKAFGQGNTPSLDAPANEWLKQEK